MSVGPAIEYLEPEPNFPEDSYIENFVERAQMAEKMREEDYIRRHAPAFISQGYRLSELKLHRKNMGKTPELDLLCLFPVRHCRPQILAMRRWWRTYIHSYRMPSKGTR